MLTQETKDFYIERALMKQKEDYLFYCDFLEIFNGHDVELNEDEDPNGIAMHAMLANNLEIPAWIFHLAARIFHGLIIEEKKQWPVDFIKALPFELSDKQWERQVKVPFIIKSLESTLDIFIPSRRPRVSAAINRAIELWKRDDIGSDDFIREAKDVEQEANSIKEWAYSCHLWDLCDALDAAKWSAMVSEVRSVERVAFSVAEAMNKSEYGFYLDAACIIKGSGKRYKKYKHLSEQLIQLMENAHGS